MRLGLLMLMGLVLAGCSQFASTEKAGEVTLLSKAQCPQGESGLRNPTTFTGVIQLVNSLPKPLSVNCFISNFDPPFDIYAVINLFSAQPAANKQSPRIFIIKNDFIISVVPAGTSRDFIEFSKVTSPGRSVKGELEFPINENLVQDAMWSRIEDTVTITGGTSCKFCHAQEQSYAGGGFSSTIIPPSSAKRVGSNFLFNEAKNCDDSLDSFRCDMLGLLYLRGPAQDVVWPF